MYWLKVVIGDSMSTWHSAPSARLASSVEQCVHVLTRMRQETQGERSSMATSNRKTGRLGCSWARVLSTQHSCVQDRQWTPAAHSVCKHIQALAAGEPHH
eukprot:99600-Pelagomonas_calceolata.AAC.2